MAQTRGNRQDQQGSPPRRRPTKSKPTDIAAAFKTYRKANPWVEHPDHAVVVAMIEAAIKTHESYPDLASGLATLRGLVSDLDKRKPVEAAAPTALEGMLRRVS